MSLSPCFLPRLPNLSFLYDVWLHITSEIEVGNMNLFLLAPPFFLFLSLIQMLHFFLSMQWKILPWCELPALGGSLADFVRLVYPQVSFLGQPYSSSVKNELGGLFDMQWLSVIVAGGVLSPLELCDVNGDGLPDILIVFTALMNASVMGKYCRSFTFLLMCQYGHLCVCLTQRKSFCTANALCSSFQSSLKLLVYCDCGWSCLKFSLQACAPIPFGQHHLFALISSWGDCLFVLHLCTLHFVCRNLQTLTLLPFSPGHSINLPGSKSLLIHK